MSLLCLANEILTVDGKPLILLVRTDEDLLSFNYGALESVSVYAHQMQ